MRALHDRIRLGSSTALLTLFALAGWAAAQETVDEGVRGGQGAERVEWSRDPRFADAPRLALVEFRDTPLVDAIRLFADQTGMNVLASPEAAKVNVTAYLRDVAPLDALDAITKANGLFWRADEASGIIRVATTEEYERDLSSFREERTEVFTLLYPNPVSVAMAIRNVFGNRVSLNFSDSDQIDILDLVQRFNRFDLVDGRSLGLGIGGQGNGQFGGGGLGGGFGGGGFGRGGFGGGGFGGGGLGMGGLGMGGLGMGGMGMGGLGMGGLGMGGMGMGGLGFGGGFNNFGGVSGRGRSQMDPNSYLPPQLEQLDDLSADQIAQLETMLRQQGEVDPELLSQLLERRQATIYVTVIRRNNQVIVRTSDERTMEQISQLIRQLDVPTPLVLLEVKVLRVVLDDGFESAFDYQFSDGQSVAGGFGQADGNRILPPASDTINDSSLRVNEALDLRGTGLNSGALAFQFVNASFRYRMQLLESRNRVTQVAAPVLLTANNEVSRIFIGDTIPITQGFDSNTTNATQGGTQTIAGRPITTVEDVGQSLLITPNINADRTVTLRIVQENSQVVENGGRIPLQTADNSDVTQVPVDTVRRSTVSGTIVAQDGLSVAIGGLIEEGVNDTRNQVPLLGRIPGLGIFFRNQDTGRRRTELVIMVRPFVFSTPTEASLGSHELMSELSLHPLSPTGDGMLGTYGADEVARPDLPCGPLDGRFRFHSVAPRDY